MKYYSEKLSKLFETEDALVKAEDAATQKEEETEKTKKDLANKVEVAEADLEAAYKNYAVVKEEAEKIAKETNNKISKMLSDAMKEVSEKESARTSAIVEFNRKFGTYKVFYSGERAEREARRISTLIDNMFSWPWF